MKTKECPKCKRFLGTRNFKKHLNVCDGIIKKPIHTSKNELKLLNFESEKYITIEAIEKFEISNNGKFQCLICKKEFKTKMGVINHFSVNHTAKKHWALGKTKENCESLKKISDKRKEGFKSGKFKPSRLGKPMPEETKIKISQTLKGISRPKMLGHPPGKGCGRGKHGWYKGYWCDSSWELAWIIYNLEHGIKFERNTKGFEYEFEGEIHKYYPDFIMEDGSYIEIKGRDNYLKLDEKSKSKISTFKGKLKILYTEQMRPFLDYAKQKYGKDYIKLFGKKEYLKEDKQKTYFENRRKRIEMIKNSNIDFSKFGWVNEVSKLFGGRRNMGGWMKRNMLDFYNEKCFKRK